MQSIALGLSGVTLGLMGYASADEVRLDVVVDEERRVAPSLQLSRTGTAKTEGLTQSWDWSIRARSRERYRIEINTRTDPAGTPLDQQRTRERRSGYTYQAAGENEWKWTDGREISLKGVIRHTDTTEREREDGIIRGIDRVSGQGATLQSSLQSPSQGPRRWSSDILWTADTEERHQSEDSGDIRLFDEDTSRLLSESQISWYRPAKRRWRASLDLEYEHRQSDFVGEAASTTEISEWRVEPSVSVRQRFNGDVTLTSKLDLELTELATDSLGNENNRRSADLKPTITLDGQVWLLSATRSVSQLDFEDFATNFDDFDEEVQAGNPDLRPQKSWELTLSGQRDWESIRINMSLEYHYTEDLLDYVAGPDGTTVRGNIGTGEEVKLSLDGQWNPVLFDAKVGRLDFSYAGRETRVFDPLLGQHRDFAEVPATEYQISHSMELQSSRFGWSVKGRSSTLTVEQDRIDRDSLTYPALNLFFQRPVGDGRLRISLNNLLGTEDLRARTRFRGIPRDGDIRRFEERRRGEGQTLQIELRRAL